MKPWENLDADRTPDGSALTLHRRDTEYAIRVDGAVLMSSLRHTSEEELATLSIDALGPRQAMRVLVGGPGMGFTLRALLGRCSIAARIDVAELLPAVIRWNRGVLADLAERPLDDGRVHLMERDVADVIRESKGVYDAILLDVDNGPSAFTTESNSSLYSLTGLRMTHAALQPFGVYAVWSAEQDRAFSGRLSRAGFDAEAFRRRARSGRGSHHVVWVAKRR